MGCLTSRIVTFWNSTFLTDPLLGLPHVFIRSPFCVPVNTAVFTVTFSTPSSSYDFPRLPMLPATYQHHMHAHNNTKKTPTRAKQLNLMMILVTYTTYN